MRPGKSITESMFSLLHGIHYACDWCEWRNVRLLQLLQYLNYSYLQNCLKNINNIWQLLRISYRGKVSECNSA